MLKEIGASVRKKILVFDSRQLQAPKFFWMMLRHYGIDPMSLGFLLSFYHKNFFFWSEGLKKIQTDRAIPISEISVWYRLSDTDATDFNNFLHTYCQ